MDDLNKNQMVLLTLLLSFVTSIATGIITTSLLQEAPPEVTQTINRVVEKTIERVVPAEAGLAGANDKPKETVKEVTVVVKEEDLLIDAIAKNSKSLLRIKERVTPEGEERFYAIGILYNADGLVVTEKRDNLSSTFTYSGTFSDGSAFQLNLAGTDDKHGLAFFRIIKDLKTQFSHTPVTFSKTELKLGQTVISVEGQDKNVVAIGRVSGFVQVAGASAADPKSLQAIETDIVPKSSASGGPLLNLNGEVVGMKVSRLSAVQGESFLALPAIEEASRSAVRQ